MSVDVIYIVEILSIGKNVRKALDMSDRKGSEELIAPTASHNVYYVK